jgi:hypothetical protein
MTNNMVTNIVVIVAMQQECEPFIKEHNLKENIPSPFHQGSPMVINIIFRLYYVISFNNLYIYILISFRYRILV